MKTCKRCGQPMASNAAEGLCARCLLSAAIKESTAAGGGPAVPHEAPEPAAIGVHFPQLEILELLGRGGMGMVYKARQPQLDRVVALKILPPADGLDPEFAERFTREARALARLSHPNIVAVYEFGQTPATGEGAVGLFYLLMEYVDGANLRQLLRTKSIAPAEALAIVPKICEALQFAHEEGVTHRDIKPENILIDKKGRVKIADFGLAKIVGHDGDAFTLTQAGMSLGTPRYMAPEQVENPGSVDHRADIYSLGVVFYEMLTGELPMGRFAPPSEKVQVDVRLDDIVLRSLEKDVERRYQHASELRSDVEDVTSPKAAPPSATPCEWLVKCVACGHTKPLREAGGLRIGGGTSGTSRFLIKCSKCGGGIGTIVRAGNAEQPDAPAPIAKAARRPRHALGLLLTIATLTAFFFGVSFQVKREQAGAGFTKTVTIGAYDPWLRWLDEPTGFQHSIHVISWSMFALLLCISLFCALVRLDREDKGKARRDPAWWRGYFARHGTLLGLLLLVLLVTGRPPHPAKAGTLSETAAPAILDEKTRAFETRIDGALAISGDIERHAALQTVAIDAAGQGVARSAKRAVEKLSFVTEHDDTAARCAKLLAPHDMAGAIEIAQLIRGDSLRDHMLGKITKPDATPVPEHPK